MDDLADTYRDYIDCLNRQDWGSLGSFVAEDVRYNGERMGLDAYRGLLRDNFREIPDLRFEIGLLLTDGARVACRLLFDCRSVGEFLGLAVNGRRVAFAENVIYEFADWRIATVWSVVDKAAIEAQLDEPRPTGKRA